MDYTPEHSNIAQTAVNLLEFTLASYEHLCGLKKQPKMELMRLEKAIESAFCRSPQGLRDYQQLAKTRTPWEKAPRVDILLRYCELGDDPMGAVHRYFLVNHHGNKDAHRE
jgi:hypothetical protein